ncbi:unnamed protein product [Owenia fusiformis]|uniref:SMP-30/Gluconolactonase/LRE-like region domain-containing protein n=1 Tax=Owenia fusiformis TaxID=6347 RepID=A0A8J1TZ36_OWEFU|nr:unnamed protein product [Owenia fusiformis]
MDPSPLTHSPSHPRYTTILEFMTLRQFRFKLEAFGSVYCYNKTTDELKKVTSGFIYPNGIVVKHDDHGNPVKLIFAVTYNKNSPLWSFDIIGPCQIRNKQVWGSLPANSVVDGLELDEEGNLIVLEYESGTMYVFGPNGGSPMCRINLPFLNATNIVFTPNSNELYMTEHEFDGLWKIHWKHKGMKQYCETF